MNVYQGIGGIAPLIRNFGEMEGSRQHLAPATLPLGKKPRAQSQFECFLEEENLFPLLGFEPQYFQRIA